MCRAVETTWHTRSEGEGEGIDWDLDARSAVQCTHGARGGMTILPDYSKPMTGSSPLILGQRLIADGGDLA